MKFIGHIGVFLIMSFYCGVVYFESQNYLYVPLSGEEAKSLCGHSYKAEKYRLYYQEENSILFIKKLKYASLLCSVFKSKDVIGYPEIVARAAFFNKKYDILYDIYSIGFSSDLSASSGILSDFISKKFPHVNSKVISSIEYRKDGVPVVYSYTGYQEINNCKWEGLDAIIYPFSNNVISLKNIKGYFFINEKNINKLKISQANFTQKLEVGLSCILKNINSNNILSWGKDEL